MRVPATSPHISAVTVAVLLGAAICAGCDLRSALDCVGASVGQRGASLVTVSRALSIGVPWSEAWQGVEPELADLERVLAPAWLKGASPVEPLKQFADSRLEQARTRGQIAAARLGVTLSLPLTMCLLPAFVLLAIVPTLLAVGGAVLGDLDAPALHAPWAESEISYETKS